MLLRTESGSPFATGATSYLYQPATGDITNRIILQVSIGDVPTQAIVDTGSPFVVCPPSLAPLIGLDPAEALYASEFKVRGITMTGDLHLLDVLFHADAGEPLMVEATVFVPHDRWKEIWGELPAYIGLTGCLERMRFAVDPDQDRFYFGGLGE